MIAYRKGQGTDLSSDADMVGVLRHLMQLVGDEILCPICGKTVTTRSLSYGHKSRDLRSLSCGHAFHEACIKKSNGVCPICPPPAFRLDVKGSVDELDPAVNPRIPPVPAHSPTSDAPGHAVNMD